MSVISKESPPKILVSVRENGKFLTNQCNGVKFPPWSKRGDIHVHIKANSLLEALRANASLKLSIVFW